MYCKLESLEEIKTYGNTTYRFCQAIVETCNNAIEYVLFLKETFRGAIGTIEGKRLETVKIMKEIETTVGNMSTARMGKKLDELDRKLRILIKECKKNETTPEEAQFYNEFVYQIVITKQTVKHCAELLKAHHGDAERELVKALKENNVDIKAYHGGSFVGNHCMHYGENGDKIIDEMTNAMKPKIRAVCNRKYLGAVGVAIKNILRCGTK